MPLQQTSGNVTSDAYGGGVAVVPNYIEDVFSTWLYTGNGSTQTITNGIDLSTKGGLVWVKKRNGVENHYLYDTLRGVNSGLESNTSNAAANYGVVSSFNSNGYTDNYLWSSSENIVSWTFRKQPKFFDVVTYTGTGSVQNIAHNLGSVPGCIIVKAYDGSGYNWAVYHRGVNGGVNPENYLLFLNDTMSAAGPNSVFWGGAAPTSTTFSVGNYQNTNQSGKNYVAYLFAHNAGGFGLTGTDNVISCGSFTSDGSGNATVNLGYEPQWILVKSKDYDSDWHILDSMRGLPAAGVTGVGKQLMPNTNTLEQTNNIFYITSTGFQSINDGAAGFSYIYIAIRRGPMKVPTDGTKVFSPVSATPSGATTVTTNFPVDLAINAQRDAGTSGNKVFWDRLRGSSTAAGQGLFSNLTNAEVSYSGNGVGLQSNTTIVDNFWNTLNGATTPVIYWNIRRAPSFFDEVCYTGNGTAGTAITHNLGVAPEFIQVKARSTANSWCGYDLLLGNTQRINFGDISGTSTSATVWNNTSPTSSNFTVGTSNDVNGSGRTYVAYLFATCAGVSKVGSYTGNGTTQTINCGFAGGARFVLIKRTDSTGDWYVYDTARGMTTLTDPYLLLNSNAAESATLGSVTTVTTGFAVNASILSAINTNSASYIFLAIA